MNRGHVSTLQESRYGRRRRGWNLPGWAWTVLAVFASMVALAFGWWVQTSESAASPEYKDVGHRVVSADEVSLTFEVVKDPRAQAVCAVKALNSNRAPVGWTEITVGPNSAEQGDARVRQQTVTFRTLEEATAVTVDSCWSTGS